MLPLPSLTGRLDNLRLCCFYATRRRFSLSCTPNLAKVTLEEKLGITPKPKKPLTPFFQFFMLSRSEIIKENPTMPIPEITKLISQKWKLADETTKNKLSQKYKLEMLKYHDLCKDYDKQLNTNDREKLLQAKLDLQIDQNKRRLKKKKNDLGCPKRPVPSYVLFSIDKAKERGSLPIVEWHKHLSKMWEELPASIKQKYVDKYKSDLVVYKKNVTLWEQEMIKKGNLDVEEHKTESKEVDIAQNLVDERNETIKEERILKDYNFSKIIKITSVCLFTTFVFCFVYIQFIL